MKSFRKELWMELPARRGYANLTPAVEAAPAKGKLKPNFIYKKKDGTEVRTDANGNVIP